MQLVFFRGGHDLPPPSDQDSFDAGLEGHFPHQVLNFIKVDGAEQASDDFALVKKRHGHSVIQRDAVGPGRETVRNLRLSGGEKALHIIAARQTRRFLPDGVHVDIGVYIMRQHIAELLADHVQGRRLCLWRPMRFVEFRLCGERLQQVQGLGHAVGNLIFAAQQGRVDGRSHILLCLKKAEKGDEQADQKAKHKISLQHGRKRESPLFLSAMFYP